jgi:hypothetical protein
MTVVSMPDQVGRISTRDPGRIPDHRTAASIQGTLALDLGMDLAPSEPDPGSVTAGVECGPIEPWAQRVVQAAVEVVGGHRPVSQLVRWVSPDVHRDLHRRALLVARASGPESGRRRPLVRPQVRSVHASHPLPGVAECSVRVRYGERSRALAARFEDRQGRWLCTALDWS